MYRNAEYAYNTLDFTGLGYITENDFMNSIIVKDRIPFTSDQIKVFFQENNLFTAGSNGISFDSFKKNFFPHLYLVQDPVDDADDLLAKKNREEIKT
jgi:hypothetical protein